MAIQVEEIRVEIQRKRIQNLYLRVKPPDGAVFVSAPRLAPDSEIESFVRSRLDWIRERREEMSGRPDPMGWVFDGRIWVWGKPYLLQVEERIRKPSVRMAEERVIMSLRPGSAEEKKLACLREWYRQILKDKANLLFPIWERKMGLRAEGWRIREMKTRWGTCNVRTGNIWLNLHLAEKPEKCLEYVIVHELSHLQVPNHGKEFWELVERYLPDWKERRERLNHTEQG